MLCKTRLFYCEVLCHAIQYIKVSQKHVIYPVVAFLLCFVCFQLLTCRNCSYMFVHKYKTSKYTKDQTLLSSVLPSPFSLRGLLCFFPDLSVFLSCRVPLLREGSIFFLFQLVYKLPAELGRLQEGSVQTHKPSDVSLPSPSLDQASVRTSPLSSGGEVQCHLPPPGQLACSSCR